MPAPFGPGRAAVLGRPRGFLPTNLPGLVLWLAADRITGLSDGDPVTTWADASGLANDATQATAAKKPTWIANGLNGKAVVRFDGVDDYLARAAIVGSALVGTNTSTLFIVQRQTVGVARSATVSWTTSSTNTFHVHLTYDDVLYFRQGAPASGGGISVNQPTGWDDTYHIVECGRDGGVGVIVVDGVTLLNGTFTDDLDTTLTADLIVGAYDATQNFFTNDVAEVVLYSDSKSTSDSSRMRAYLNQKWAVY